jgi:hypothetical protein
MNDLTGAKVLMDEIILGNAVEDKYFTSKMKFKNSSNSSSIQKKK